MIPSRCGGAVHDAAGETFADLDQGLNYAVVMHRPVIMPPHPSSSGQPAGWITFPLQAPFVTNFSLWFELW